jgi:hypothetical protein
MNTVNQHPMNQNMNTVDQLAMNQNQNMNQFEEVPFSLRQDLYSRKEISDDQYRNMASLQPVPGSRIQNPVTGRPNQHASNQNWNAGTSYGTQANWVGNRGKQCTVKESWNAFSHKQQANLRQISIHNRNMSHHAQEKEGEITESRPQKKDTTKVKAEPRAQAIGKSSRTKPAHRSNPESADDSWLQLNIKSESQPQPPTRGQYDAYNVFFFYTGRIQRMSSAKPVNCNITTAI